MKKSNIISRTMGSDWVTWENNPLPASHIGGVWEHQIQAAKTILDALHKTLSCNLNDKYFRTLLAETEGIINCRLLVVGTLSDGSFQLIQQGYRIIVLESSSNFYYLIVSMREVFPENFSFRAQFILPLWWFKF